MVNITIRGIEDEVYNEFSAEARKLGMPIGKLVTKAMEEFLSSDEEIYSITNMKELNISKKDLESVDKQVLIKNVSKLTFEKGIDWKIFSKAVFELINISEIEVPKEISKFQLLTKCKNVSKIKYL